MTKNSSILDLLPPAKAPELSPRMRRFLRFGNDGTYTSNFDYEWALALAAVNAGKNEAWLRKVLIDKGPHYEYIRTKPYPWGGQGKADKYVSMLYAKAVAYREQNPPWRSKQDASVALKEHASWVQTLPNWRGRVGNRNLEVLLAAINVGIEVGSNVVSFSTRQLAEQMKRKRQTVGKALHDLERDRWLLKLQEKRSITEAPTYKIPIASSGFGSYGTTNIFSPLRGVGSSGPQTPPLIFDELGISAYRAWSLLDEDEGTEVKTLVKVTGLSERTIREALLRLDSVGAATKKDGEWYRVAMDLDALAYERGLHIRRALKAQQHERQRAKRLHDLGLGDRLAYHRKNDLLGEERDRIIDEHTPALASAQKPRSEDGVHLPSDEVQSRPEVSDAGASEREDGRASLYAGGSQPVQYADASGIPVMDAAGMGQPVDPPRARGGRGTDDEQMRRGVCSVCGHEAMSIPRSDGLALCPKDRRAMAFDAERWERLSIKPVPDALKALVPVAA